MLGKTTNKDNKMKKSTKQAILGASVFSIIGGIAASHSGEPVWVIAIPSIVGGAIAYLAIDNR